MSIGLMGSKQYAERQEWLMTQNIPHLAHSMGSRLQAVIDCYIFNTYLQVFKVRIYLVMLVRQNTFEPLKIEVHYIKWLYKWLYKVNGIFLNLFN